MSKRRQFTPKLISVVIIDSQLHYGVYARNWWEMVSILSAESNNKYFTIPYRLFMRIGCELNGREFVITVTSNDKNPLKPGFQCICGEFKSEIELYPSTAVKSCYQSIFNSKTEYSGLAIMGFENENIIQQLIADILFFPIFLRIENFLVVITNLGSLPKHDGNFYEAGVGFVSSLISRYNGAQHLFLLKIEKEYCVLEIHQELTCVQKIIGETLDNVWCQLTICQKYTGSYLFGTKNALIQEKLGELENIPIICKYNDWTNIQQLEKVLPVI
ncbi:hypothetical protein Glove_43g54 [Diversispora epigaea]|uniref:Uncharacterized protein n=1 Tax=Diversispora epigaea TaxID=1348612 RepID=A0A397JJ53_9GLOM|nr:hypothetical protein Glove_43g54 [Diversispora epigaea]